jgi:3-hydroxyacyl-[acyl-carrier-protein] dehydratase
MTSNNIIDQMPYQSPFLFVDEITTLTEELVEGTYQFKEDEFFYEGHFKNNPITPGVILIETMAQIGVVAMGMLILKEEVNKGIQIAFASSQVDFFLPIYPGNEVKVRSERIYYRFNKLKCSVSLFNENNELACRGIIAGMIKHEKHE